LAKLLSYMKARREAGLRRPGPRGPDSNRHVDRRRRELILARGRHAALAGRDAELELTA
jgi:hypothetical protein